MWEGGMEKTDVSRYGDKDGKQSVPGHLRG